MIRNLASLKSFSATAFVSPVVILLLVPPRNRSIQKARCRHIATILALSFLPLPLAGAQGLTYVAGLNYSTGEPSYFGTVDNSGHYTQIGSGIDPGTVFTNHGITSPGVVELMFAPNGTLYGFSATENTGFSSSWGTIDPATGAFTKIGDLSQFNQEGLAPVIAFTSNGSLFAAGEGTNNQPLSGIYNPTTGSFTQTGSLGIAPSFGLGFTPSVMATSPTGLTYVAGWNSSTGEPSYFGTVDNSGHYTQIGSGIDPGTVSTNHGISPGVVDLMFAPNGTLYGFCATESSGFSSSWGTIDPATGAFTKIGDFSQFNSQDGIAPVIAFTSNGSLFAAGVGTNNQPLSGIYNPTTGSFTQTGSLGITPFFGGGFIPLVMATSPSTLIAGGGSPAVGGASADFGNATVGTAGTFTSNYQTVTSHGDLQTALGTAAAGAINFGLAGTDSNGVVLPNSAVQFWDMHFTGTFTGDASVTLHYDPTLIGGVNPLSLVIWHYTNGGWNPVANEVVNPVTDTITFTTDSFSPFILGVPEPSSIGLLSAGTVALGITLLHGRRRRS